MGFVTQLGQGLGIMPPNPQTTQDFTAAGIQQGIDNQNAATFNTNLNRLNQTGPGGSLTYTTGADGNPVQNYTLSSGQQTLYDNAQNLATGISGLANTSLGQAQNALSNGVTRDLAGSGIQTAGGAYGGGGGVSAGSTSGGVAAPAAQATTTQAALDQAKLTQADPAAQAKLAQAVASQAALTQAGPAAQGAASTSSGDSSIQRTFDHSGVRALPGEIDDTSRRRVEEAIMSRLNPQYQNDEHDLRSRLLNSGIEVGTDAYNREMNNFSQRLNDARMQAILAGGTEESRQVGLIQGLNAQEYAQALSTGQFAQSADTSMANNRTQSSIANAQLATQASLANAGFLNQNNLANAGFANTNSQFNTGQSNAMAASNAQAENALNQFNTGQTNNTELYNTGQANANSQFNTGQANANSQYNAGQANAGSQFNTGQTNNVNVANAGFQTQAGIANANNATSASIASGNQALQATSINNAAHMQNITEQLAIRDQQMQELAALQGMSQPTGQTFGNYYTGGNAAPTPTLDAAIGATNAWKNQNTQASNQGGMFGTIGSIVSAFF